MQEFTLTNVDLLGGRGLGKIHVAAGRIEEMGTFSGVRGKEIDGRGVAVLPALIDNHVHFREPGAEEKEDFASGSAAAAHGGAATVLEVQNSPPLLTTPDLVAAKRRLVSQKSRVNVGFYASAVPATLERFAEMASLTAGFKLFMAPSHGDQGCESRAGMHPFFAACTRHDALLIVHAEDGRLIAEAGERVDGGRPENFSRLRPPQAEIQAVATAIELARECGTRLHVFHLSTAGAVDLIADARREGLDLSASTCPHYLFFTDADVAERGALLKCYPSIKSDRDRARLVEGVRERIIEVVSTDHAPHRPEEKERSFGAAPAGIASSDLYLPLMTTLAARGVLTLDDVTELCCRSPARIHRLLDGGELAPGRAADIVLFDPGRRWVVKRSDFRSRAVLSPYEGMELTGRVAATLVGGRPAYVDREGPLHRALAQD